MGLFSDGRESRLMFIRELILGYVEHVKDFTYMESLLAMADIDTVFDELAELLGSENGEQASIANLFIRDIALLAPEHIGREFKRKIRDSYLIEALNSNIFSKNHFVRYDSIYTLGKLGITRSINLLIEAFHTYKETDPIILPGLVFELFWLQENDDWEIVGSLLQSPNYPTRWSTLRILDHTVYQYPNDPKPAKFKKSCIKKLIKDENQLIQQEAIYQNLKLEYAEKTLDLPKKEKRIILKKEVESFKPSICFMNVQIQFTNYLIETKKTSYTINELKSFIDKMSQKRS